MNGVSDSKVHSDIIVSWVIRLRKFLWVVVSCHLVLHLKFERYLKLCGTLMVNVMGNNVQYVQLNLI